MRTAQTMDEAELSRYLELAKNGDPGAMGALLDGQRARLERMVSLRLDRRLRGRIDAADVIQDTFLEAARRFSTYLENPAMPFYLWLRFLANQRLQALCRENLGTQKRDARLELSVDMSLAGSASSEALAARLLGSLTTPSQALVRAEMKARLREALDALEPADREVIALRHFEELSHAEAAQVLSLSEGTASKRYLRAVKRLKALLDRIPGMSDFPWK